MLLNKYIYYVPLLPLLLLGDIIIDTKPRLSKLLRIAAYLSMLIIAWIINLPENSIAFIFYIIAITASIIITVYSEGYLRILFGKVNPLISIMDTTLYMVTLFYASQTLGEFIILWIIVEFMSSLLIILERGTRLFNTIVKYLAICVTTGDLSLFTIIAIVASKIGLAEVFTLPITSIPELDITLTPLLTILVLIGFTTKLGQIPLHVWLPDTYTNAPSPATAVLSGLISKMAVYALLMVNQWFTLDLQTYTALLLFQGLLTTIYGALSATMHTDIKKIMSYSSMGHYGVITLILALLPFNRELFTITTLLYAVYHSFVKIHVFLNIASIELLTNTTDIYRLGYLGLVEPRIYNTSVIAFLSLTGIPPTLGFYAKLLLFVSIITILSIQPLPAILALVGIGIISVFSLIYSMKYLSIYISAIRPATRKIPAAITNLQLWSETLLAIAMISLTPIVIIAGLNSFLDLVVISIYILSILALVIAYYLKRVTIGKEAKTWLGGIEA